MLTRPPEVHVQPNRQEPKKQEMELFSGEKIKIVVVGLLFAAAAAGRPAPTRHQSVDICPLVVPGDVGLPAEFHDHLMADLVAELGDTKAFRKAFREGADNNLPTPAPRLVGEITEFKKGGQAKRDLLRPFSKPTSNS